MRYFSNEKVIDVDTGELKVSSEPVILQSIALGSCVALTTYEPNKKIGGLAHIMLPGKSPSSKNNTKYAEDSIEALLEWMNKLGATKEKLEISIVGGANVLQEGDIPDKVIESVLSYLEKIDIKVKCMRVGGILRRSMFINTATGDVHYTEGDNPTKILLSKIERIK